MERIATPTWIASGAEDRLAPLTGAQYLASCLPNSSIQVIPSAGHMLLAEQPAALAAGLQAFLQKLPPLGQNQPVPKSTSME